MNLSTKFLCLNNFLRFGYKTRTHNNSLLLYRIKKNLSQRREIKQSDHVDSKHDVNLNPFSYVSDSNKTFLEDLQPPLKRSFNLAAYVNRSSTLQNLMKLGVSLYDIENTNNEAAKYIVSLDFEKDCLPFVQFLVDNGLKEKNLGRFISEFPLIFREHLDDLQVRINFLQSKGFSKKMIAKALNRSSFIISQSTKTTEYKMGILQIEFGLSLIILRKMIANHPSILALPDRQYSLINFVIHEEFGFTPGEVRRILEDQPQVLDILRPMLIDRIDLAHNQMGFSHKVIVQFPKLITGPRMDIANRFKYLKKLKRNQFNPSEPLYVPPTALYSVDDQIFCERYAKTNLDDYKLFLKSI